MAKKQYYQNEDGDIICYTGKTPSKEDRTLVAEELHSGESKLKTINGQSLIGEGDIAIEAGVSRVKTINGVPIEGSGDIVIPVVEPTLRTLRLSESDMAADSFWKLGEDIRPGQLDVVEVDGQKFYAVPGCPYSFLSLLPYGHEATSENSMDVKVVIVLRNIAFFDGGFSVSVETDAETGDSRVVTSCVDPWNHIPSEVNDVMYDLGERVGDRRELPGPDADGWTPSESLINLAASNGLYRAFENVDYFFQCMDTEYVKMLIGEPEVTDIGY